MFLHKIFVEKKNREALSNAERTYTFRKIIARVFFNVHFLYTMILHILVALIYQDMTEETKCIHLHNKCKMCIVDRLDSII